MNVKEGSFVLLNVLSLSQITEKDKWLEPAVALRNHVVTDGIYPVGPVVFEKTEVENEPHLSEYTFYLALNESIEINEESPYEFDDVIAIPEAIYVRYSDDDGEVTEAYNLLQKYAEENNLKISDSYFHVCLDVYGEIWMDIYAPIVPKEVA